MPPSLKAMTFCFGAKMFVSPQFSHRHGHRKTKEELGLARIWVHRIITSYSAMKRRNSENNPRDPSQIWRITRTGFHGVWSSDNGTSISRDVSCRKRVKFTDLDNDDPISCRPDASSIPLERTRATRSDDPKTSEFAFFKNLKEDAGHRFHSHLLHTGGNQSEKFKSSAYSSERSDVVKNSFKDFRPSLLIDNATALNFDSIVTPLGSASKNSEMNMKRTSATLADACSIQNNLEAYSKAPRTGGTQNKLGEIFSRKREKLRRWVAEHSFPEIDELCSKGLDTSPYTGSFIFLVPFIWTPLRFSQGFKDLKSGKVEIDAKSQLFASPESDIHLKKLHQMPRRSLMEPERGPYLDDDSSSCWLNISGERIFSNYDFLTSFADKAHTPCEISEPGFELGGRTPVLCTETGSTFGIPFEKYGSLASSHLKELDPFHNSNECFLAREPHTLLLGWDFDNMTDERSSSVTNHNTELSVYPTSLSSWSDDQQQSLDDKFCASGLCTSSFLSSYPPNSTSVLHSPLASFGNHDFGRRVLVDQEDIVAELNHIPLTVWHRPNYLNLAEDFNYSTDYKGSSIILSPQNHHCFMSKVFSERHHHPGMGSFLLSSEPDFDLGWKCLSITDSSREHQSFTNHALQFPPIEGISSRFLTNNEYENCLDDSMHRETLNHFSKDTLNIHDWSSFYFQASLEREKACPLLHDKSSWNGSEGESYFGDSEVKYT